MCHPAWAAFDAATPPTIEERCVMNAHVSAILLGVRDMDHSKRFYTEGLGWEIKDDWKISVFFVPHGGSMVGFYGRAGLAEMVGTSGEGSGFPGLVLQYIVRSEERVDQVIDEAKAAGATILKAAGKLPWGGYGGTFADPDGYVWSVGFSAQGRDQDQLYAE
jgi:catechol 2,3-dioxygenase-like lactoylglutathione lyase family enzyme